MNESKPPPSENELIRALKTGDERALNSAYKQIYRQGYALVETMIMRNGGIAEDAQDVFQDVLLVLVNKLHNSNFQLTCALNTYLYAVARNQWKARLRDRKSKVEFKDTLHDFEDPAESDVTLKKLFERKHEIIRQLLETLSDSCQKILVSFYYEKKSMREIGESMKLAEDGLRVQKHRCMTYLKRKVEAHPDYPDLKK